MYREAKELLEYLNFAFKNRMKFQIIKNESGFFDSIVVIPNDNSVYDQIITSRSVLVPSSEINVKSYENRILEEIQKMQDEQLWINSIFYYIMQLPIREKHYIIAHYFAEQTNQEIMDFLGIKNRTLNQIKSNALLHLGMLVPGGIKIKKN